MVVVRGRGLTVVDGGQESETAGSVRGPSPPPPTLLLSMPHVWLNVTPEVTGMTAEQLKTGYPVIYKHCLECGVDLTKEAIPVVPAAHYTCGGIPVDLNGCTQVERLYAVGECSYTGAVSC